MKREFKKNEEVYIAAGATFVYRDKGAKYDSEIDVVGFYADYPWKFVSSGNKLTSILNREVDGISFFDITIEIANKDILTSYPQ